MRDVDAVGASVFGGHEDMVNARLNFENGCVAHITASRITPRPKRRLRVWAPEGYAGIDFVSRKLTLVQPSPEVRQFGLRVDRMDANSKARLKDDLFGRYMQVMNVDGDRKNDQLTSELRHFIDCVRSGRTPRVTGEDGREALALAEAACSPASAITAWEGHPDGAPSARTRCPAPPAGSSTSLAAKRREKPQHSVCAIG